MSEPGRPGIHECCVLTCLSLRFHWGEIFSLTLELLLVDSTIQIGECFVWFLPSICLIGMITIHTTKLWVSFLLQFNYPLCLYLIRLQDVHKPKSRDREWAWILGRILMGMLYVLRVWKAKLNSDKMLELRWWLRYLIIYYYMHLPLLK